MNKKQIQKAGKYSKQFQVDTINIGIDEKRAREINSEMFAVMLRDLTHDAYAIAEERVSMFEKVLLPKIQAVEGALNEFKDPAFQFLLVKAQKSAAASERIMDYTMLSDLLIERIQKKDDKNVYSGISRAVEIVDKISNEALIGLTMAFVIERYKPTTGIISEGLDDLNNVFKKLCYGDLSKGINWLDNLDILSIVRIITHKDIGRIGDKLYVNLSGYCVDGIQHGSENYYKAIDILKNASIHEDILVEHELRKGYVRLPFVTKGAIDVLEQDEKKKNALHEVYNMYDKTAALRNSEAGVLNAKLMEKPNIKIVGDWWHNIPLPFSITAAGKALAIANLRRLGDIKLDFD